MFQHIKFKAVQNKLLSLVAICCLILIFSILSITQAKAQLTSFHSGLFQNQYLINPAFAGLDKGLRLSLGLQQQLNTVPGSPKLQNYTADYYAGSNVGIGINISNNQAGLVRRTRVMGTYAYHLTVNDEDKLNFGLSLGINDTYIDPSQIVGDQGDVAVNNFNQRPIYVDGDFGVSYTSKGINAQVAIPNLKNMFFKGNEILGVDRATFYTAASYKFPFENQFLLEPKVAFRGIKGAGSIFDVGVNFAMEPYKLNISGVYHTNQSSTFGVGLNLTNFNFLLAYTNNTGPLKTYLNNTFEIGFQLKLFQNN